MITSVRLTNFKNFADETLKLGPFTVIVGANASGKSNIRDAFRFLHGIGRGYSLAEIIGGKIGVGGQLEWEPIRGAPNEIVRMESERRRVRKQFSIATDVELDGAPSRYSVAIGYGPRAAQGFRVIQESLNVDGSNVFEKERGSRVRLNPSIAGGDRMITPSLTQPVLTQVRLRPTSLSSKPEWRNEIFWEPKGALSVGAWLRSSFSHLNLESCRKVLYLVPYWVTSAKTCHLHCSRSARMQTLKTPSWHGSES